MTTTEQHINDDEAYQQAMKLYGGEDSAPQREDNGQGQPKDIFVSTTPRSSTPEVAVDGAESMALTADLSPATSRTTASPTKSTGGKPPKPLLSTAKQSLPKAKFVASDQSVDQSDDSFLSDKEYPAVGGHTPAQSVNPNGKNIAASNLTSVLEPLNRTPTPGRFIDSAFPPPPPTPHTHQFTSPPLTPTVPSSKTESAVDPFETMIGQQLARLSERLDDMGTLDGDMRKHMLDVLKSETQQLTRQHFTSVEKHLESLHSHPAYITRRLFYGLCGTLSLFIIGFAVAITFLVQQSNRLELYSRSYIKYEYLKNRATTPGGAFYHPVYAELEAWEARPEFEAEFERIRLFREKSEGLRAVSDSTLHQMAVQKKAKKKK